ncbi:TonB-dependent receptor [Desulfosarcina variabilis str. Montpellier]
MESVVIALVFLTISGFSYAQDTSDIDNSPTADPPNEILELETIVVTGSATDDEKQEIESRKLRVHNLVDFAEILSDELVEVSMIRKGGYGNEVSVRGFGQENFKVLLDGGILEGACGSRKDPHLSHINMLTVKKLKVQQGPFDVTKLGALGGYVDVITKKPEPGFNGEILGKVGSYGFYSGGATTSGGSDNIQGLLGYNYSESDQYEDGSGNPLWKVREGLPASYNQEGRDAKSFQKNDIWGKLQFTPSDSHTILLEHTYGKAEDILTPRVAFDTEEEITNLSKASWEMRNLGDLSKKLTLSFYRNEVDHYPFQDLRNVAVPKNNKVESVITGSAIQNVTQTDFATLTYGIDVYHRDWWGDVYNSLTGVKLNDNLIPAVQSMDIGGYVQMDKDFDKWAVGLGLRYDRFEQEADEELVFTSAVTNENRKVDDLLGGHFSVNYFLNDSAMLFGGLGRSYRTPTSSERYIQGNATFFGNPNLEPTANTELDLGFKFERGRWMFQAKGFYSDLKDYIYQENNLAGYRSYTNIDAHIYGGDIKAGVDLIFGFSLDGGLAYQRGRKDSFPDNNNDKDLGQIAPLKSRLALNYKNEQPLGQKDTGLFGTVEWVHSDTAKDIDTEAGEQELAAWDIMNLRVGYQFKWCTLNVGMDNVFDQTYKVANSYEWDVIGGTGANPAIVNEPGRFIYASLGFNW